MYEKGTRVDLRNPFLPVCEDVGKGCFCYRLYDGKTWSICPNARSLTDVAPRIPPTSIRNLRHRRQAGSNRMSSHLDKSI